MKKYNEILKKYGLKPYKYELIGKVVIITCLDKKYVLKQKNRDENNQIYKYLESRNFDYYPKIYSDNNDDYTLMEYVDEIDIPKEQKMQDLIEMVALLHNKTTHYKEINPDDYKKIYEDISNNIEYLTSYYNDILEIIESHIYMSPSEYLLARNCSKIFGSLNYCKKEIKAWLDIIKNKKKQRFVVLHNNLDLSHFIKNKDYYLLNWEKSKIDIPIFDIYKLYKRNAIDFDFSSLLKLYEKSYPLLEEERKLFFILISLPDKIEFSNNELEDCIKISKFIDYMYKTESLLSPYYSKEGKEQENNK